jgi:hypothetical protein
MISDDGSGRTLIFAVAEVGSGIAPWVVEKLGPG